MPSAAEEKRAQFVKVFNATLGDKVGRPIRYQTDAQLLQAAPERIRDNAANRLAKKVKVANAKTPKVTTPTTAAQIQALLGGGGNKAAGTLSSGLVGNGSNLKINLEGPAGSGIQNTWKTVDNAITNNPVVNFLQNNPVTRVGAHALPAALDAVSRPFYGVAEAINRGSRADSGWSIPTEFFHGAVAGVTGKKHTGFGDVLNRDAEHMKQAAYLRSVGRVAEADKLEHDTLDKTGFEQWSQRILGGVGDVVLDPTTYLSLGSTTIAKDAVEQGGRALGKAAAKGSVDFGKDALKNRVQTIVKDVVDQHRLPNKLKPRPGSTVNTSLIDHITNQVHDRIDKVVYDLHKGGMIGGHTSDYGTIAHSIAEASRDSLIESVKKPAAKFVADIKNGKRFTTAERDTMKAKDPLFGQWLDAAEKISQKGKFSIDDIASKADQEFTKIMEPKIQAIYATAKGQLDDALLNVPTIQFMGKKIYLPKVGEGLQKFGKSAIGFEHPQIANFNKAWRYSSWFPGYTTHISQKLKSMNVQRYDNFKADIENLLHDTTKEQRINIHRAIQEGIDLPGVDGDIQKEIKRHYKDMYQEEIGMGARSAKVTPPADNYVYNQVLKSGKAHPDFVNKIKVPKLEQVRLHKNINGFTSQELKAQGWKVEEDAGQALLSRKAKSIRELSRVNFKRDLVEHYGIRSSIAPHLAEKTGMHRLNSTQYADLYKNLKPGESLYLDKDIEKIFNNYNELVQYGKNARADAVTTGLDKVTKLFKTANTIYWPGFHIRNAVSDIFMGMLDGVKNHRYGQIMNGMLHKDTAFLKVGGERVPFRQVYKSYLDNAATAGFFDSEMKHAFNPSDLSTGRFMDSTLKDTLGRVNSKLRAGSQVREDFGRLVHYYHALDDEMTAQLAKGVPRTTAWKNAEEAAISRVNKFKFDYNALTPNEQRMRRFGMPFYTYMRKATPVLLENLFMHPKYFSYINKAQHALAPSDQFTGASLPGWMHEMAYSELASSSHIGLTDAMLPTRTLKETFSNPILRANPLAQGLVEYQTHKDLFSGKPVGTGVQGITDILKNKWRGITTYRSIESGTKPTIEKWAGLLGIPIVQVTPGRQGQRLREIEQQMTDKVTQINTTLDNHGFKVRVTGNKIYLIQPKSPTADEIRHNKKPRYPINDKEKILGAYDSFDQLMSNFKT